ncbi:hypothetical protein [Clostridium vincentii]|uniref:Uncharacterized protein n=1 Tax=Clostridium vincentii TaxID=52704 RepID=A0A2T0B600_9CLOT|nr:hypothetical protein [Clostridium vincentii]PRR79217.1 hypothetical protein CLVI_33990 [Clostridium vincentii]
MNRNKKTKNVKMNKTIENIQNSELTNNVDTTNNSKKESDSFR